MTARPRTPRAGLVVAEEWQDSLGAGFAHMTVHKPEGWAHPTLGLSVMGRLKARRRPGRFAPAPRAPR
jgi:hypothetical protein